MSRTLRHVVILVLACGPLYFAGLTVHGLANWQEAQRALVAQAMGRAGEWVVPTVDGRAYLAKPPLIYWCQLALSRVRGGAVSEFDLRLTVALAGLAGVVAVYFAARRLARDHLRELAEVGGAAEVERAWRGGDLESIAARVGLWSGLFTATGFLYVRSSRIGELDILLAPTVVVAIAALHAAWVRWDREGRWPWGAAVVAGISAALAGLAKGPTGLAVIGLAVVGGVLWRHRVRPSDRLLSSATLMLGVFCAVWVFNRAPWSTEPVESGVGMVAMGAIGWMVGRWVAWTLTPGALRGSGPVLVRVPVVVSVVAGIGAVWVWTWGVEARIGGEAIRATVQAETEDNLRLLVAESPLNNLEALAYGAGLGSIFAVPGLWALGVFSRVGSGVGSRTRSSALLAAWAMVGFVLFSTMGKGVPRYLTPLWPALGMCGGFAVVWLAGRVRSPGRFVGWLAVVTGALVVGQSWWYGWGRAHWPPEGWRSDRPPPSARSPRDFVRELMSSGSAPVSGRLGAFEIDHPALDVYAGFAVDCFVTDEPSFTTPAATLRPIEEVRGLLGREGGVFVMLVRRSPLAAQDPRPAADRLAALGFEVRRVALASRFRIDNFRTDVEALELRVPR